MRGRVFEAGIVIVGVVSLGMVAACSTGRRRPIDPEAVRQAVLAEAARQDRGSVAGASDGSDQAPATAAGAQAPRTDDERRARVRAALGADVDLRQVVAVAEGGHLTFALVTGERANAGGAFARLILLDASVDPARRIAEHVFAGASAEVPATPDRIRAPVAVEAADRAPLALAVLEVAGRSDADGGPVVAACGWWLRREGARFLCAPKMGFASDFVGRAGWLVEWWATPLPGDPPHGTPTGGRSGRVSRSLDLGWREIGRFRCLRRAIETVLEEVEPAGLEAWQRASVLRLLRSARELAGRLETVEATRRLEDALQVDACDADAWRALGRLRYEAGRAAEAVPALSLSLAMSPSEPATLLALADALDVLDMGSEVGGRAWRRAQIILGDRPATRALLEASVRRGRGPRALSLTLDEQWLERSAADDAALAISRRRIEQRVRDRGGEVPTSPPAPAGSP